MKRSFFKKKKTEWDKVRAKLKPRFEKAGIICCELRYEGCARDNFLGFAHALKRRHLDSHRFFSNNLIEVGDPRHMETTILACNFCHDRLERLLEEQMKLEVMKIIQKRRIQP